MPRKKGTLAERQVAMRTRVDRAAAARVAAKAAVKANRIAARLAAEAARMATRLAAKEAARKLPRIRIRKPRYSPTELARRVRERANLWDAGRLARLTKRFWAKVNKDGPVHPVLGTRCWLWTGDVNNKGYGRISETVQGRAKERAKAEGRKRWTMATHLSFFLAFGVWPVKQMCHACDNKPCINPEHLFEGTQADNQYDHDVKAAGGVLVDWPQGPV